LDFRHEGNELSSYPNTDALTNGTKERKEKKGKKNGCRGDSSIPQSQGATGVEKHHDTDKGDIVEEKDCTPKEGGQREKKLENVKGGGRNRTKEEKHSLLGPEPR